MLPKSADHGFFIGETFKSAWEIFKKEWILVYVIQLLPIVIAIVYTMVSSQTDQTSGFSFLWMIVYFILQLVISAGMIKAYVELIRGKKVDFNTVFSVAPRVVSMIIAQIFMGLIISVGFLLFIIPGIIFIIKFMFAPYLVIDKGMGPIEALKASSKMTDGIKWDILGFLAADMVLMYSGILALFVGILVTAPVGTLAYVVLYDRLLKRL